MQPAVAKYIDIGFCRELMGWGKNVIVDVLLLDSFA
jgi:hypothetical protein